MTDANGAADGRRKRFTFVTVAPYYPEAVGGAQLSTHTLLTILAGLGWDVGVICAKEASTNASSYLGRRWRSAINALAGPSRETDMDCGYACTRFGRLSQLRLRPLFAELERRGPTVIATEIGTGGHTPSKLALLRSLIARPAPSFVFVRTLSDPAFERIDGWSGPHLTFVANSPFVAGELERLYGIAAKILLPVIEIDGFGMDDADKRPFVTFINPVPEKGASVFVEIAERMPDVRFLVVKGKWSQRDYDGAGDLDAIARLPNVRIAAFTNDVVQIYRQTRVLLVPSQFPEPFGRVVVEAQANGIPVVASDRGGLRYAVGAGGMLVSPADAPGGYVDALYALLRNDAAYREHRRAALANAEGYRHTRESQLNDFLSGLNGLLRH